jgi:dipeptidyl aminopeptidase/acylaminoacyl peptidase
MMGGMDRHEVTGAGGPSGGSSSSGASRSGPLPCGSWPSPFDAQSLTAAALRLGSPGFLPDGAVLWVEGRPADSGRSVLVKCAAIDCAPTTLDLTPPPLDVRSRVHEYGGGAYTVLADEVIFVDARSGALYRQRAPHPPRVLTAPGPDWRFGDLVADPSHDRVLAVAEHHRRDGAPEDLLVAIDAATGAIEILAAGADFYASPAPSADGSKLAWVAWNHPHMPWDAATVYLADLDAAGLPQSPRPIAGDATRSAQQPAFAPDGMLYILLESADPNGKTARWTLHRWDDASGEVIPVIENPTAELGLPPWQLGTRTWGLIDEKTALAAAISDGQTTLCQIDLASGQTTTLPISVAHVAHLAIRAGRVVMQAGRAEGSGGIFTFDLAQVAEHVRARTPTDFVPTLLRPALPLALAPEYVSLAEPIRFATSAGDRAHGFFYPPRNPEAQPRAGELPPLIVIVHGGPTAATTPAFNPLVQFWTTRGLAVLDVNYRGSTGFGRVYRDRLRGQWGVYDVDDCIAGARALVAAGRVDPNRLAIRGSSAGGFTVLAALTAPDALFHAGASLYGVSDLAALAKDTHKFESRYLDQLVGPWPQRADLYAERSPINHCDCVRCPIIFFQGLDDKVVPPDQTERFVQVLRDQQLPAEMHTFAGEQHGFRRADTLKTVYTAELGFYGRVFGFTPR